MVVVPFMIDIWYEPADGETEETGAIAIILPPLPGDNLKTTPGADR